MNTVPSAARVLDLLEFLAGIEGGVSLTTAASSLGLAKSSTLLLLRTLVARGYAVRRDDDLYVLNESVRRHGFGWGGMRFAPLVAVATPVMESLSEQLGETVVLGALGDDWRVRKLAKMVAKQDIRYDVDLTTPLPLYCTAMGRVLLGSMPAERQAAALEGEDRLRLTPATLVDIEEIRRAVALSAARGYCIVAEEFALGGTGVAAPIVDRDGRVIAVLDVACVTTRFRAKRKGVVAALLAAAKTVTSLLPAAPRPGRSARLSRRPPGARRA